MDVVDRADLPFPRSLPEFQRLFPDDAACAAYLEKARWGASSMRLRRPLPAVQGDTLHIVGVGDNRIGKASLAYPVYTHTH